MTGKTIAALAAFVCALLLSAASYAQDHSRNWDFGNVVVMQVDIKPGMTNAYMNDIGNL